MEYVFIYVAASLFIALFGIDRKFGFWGYFFGSLLFSPVIGLFLLLASDKRKQED
ncbi:MAG: hypothetical protein KKB30_13385 [Proteobacteria bacterium]|nr:hypothetical protein [Pseudomonadota bacterium]MBU1715012.1 hypothetical protein [Pseudomonadota bacterium]